MPSPEAICTQVPAALEHEPRINLHRCPVHLRCEDGILTADGDIESSTGYRCKHR
jgi:hypothetical protein